MFDIGWSEMAVIALVALVILGPKELPQAMRTFASFTKKMRRYAQEFRAGVDNIVREAELEDARKALEVARKANPKNLIRDMVDPTGEVTQEIKSVEASARGDDKSGDKGVAKALPSAAGAGAAGAVSAEPAKAGEEKTGEEAAEAPKSNRVTEPFVMAPPHSLRPPAPEPVEAKPAKTEPDEPAKSSDKSA